MWHVGEKNIENTYITYYNYLVKLTNLEILTYLSKKPIGKGTEAITYDAGKYVLRMPKHIKNNSQFRNNLANNVYKTQKTQNVHGRRNFGQAIYNLIDESKSKIVLSVCKKADGFPTNDLVEQPLTQKQILTAQKTAIAKMKIIASAPSKSFYKLIDDLNHLTHTNFTIDPSEGNLLIDPETKKFYIIDLRPVKKIRNIGDLILLLLTDIPDMPANSEYFYLETKIINKLIKAAKSRGLLHREQLQFKPRAMEVIKSQQAREIYKKNYDKIKLV